MKRIYQLFLIGLVLTLVILGLNISNEAINQLTVSQRPPIIDVQASSSQLVFHIAGQQYDLDVDKLGQASTVMAGLFDRAVEYLHKIWRIFQVVFLY